MGNRTSQHKLGGLQQHMYLLPHSSRSQKSKIKVSAGTHSSRRLYGELPSRGCLRHLHPWPTALHLFLVYRSNLGFTVFFFFFLDFDILPSLRTFFPSSFIEIYLAYTTVSLRCTA